MKLSSLAFATGATLVTLCASVYAAASLHGDGLSHAASAAVGFAIITLGFIACPAPRSGGAAKAPGWKTSIIRCIAMLGMTFVFCDVMSLTTRGGSATDRVPEVFAVLTGEPALGGAVLAPLARHKYLLVIPLALAFVFMQPICPRLLLQKWGPGIYRTGYVLGRAVRGCGLQLLKVGRFLLEVILFSLTCLAVGYQPERPPVLLRGRRVMSLDEARKRAAQRLVSPDPGIWFGGLRLVTSAARCGFAIIGACGSGKTTIIERMFSEVLARIKVGGKQRALILDTKLETVSYLKSLNVQVPIHILHPFDERGVAWDIAKDCRTPAAVGQLASNIVPEEKTSNNRFFTDASRELVRGSIQYLNEQGDWWTLRDLVLLLRGLDDLQFALAQSPHTASALQLLGNEDTARNVFASLATVTRRYETIAAAWATAPRRISVAEWVRGESILVLGLNEQVRHPLGAIYRVLLQLVTEALLDQPETPDVNNWLILDEVRHIGGGVVSGLRSLCTNGRSRGNSVTLGFQDIEGMREAFGEREANELVAQCSNLALLRIQSPVTAQYASDSLGQCDWCEFPIGGGKNGRTYSEQVVTRPVRLPGEFMGLPQAGPQHGTPGVFASADLGVWSGAISAAEILPPTRAPRDRSLNFQPRPDSAQILQPWTAAERARLGLAPSAAPPAGDAAESQPLKFIGKRKPNV
jgi:hypothetical protein